LRRQPTLRSQLNQIRLWVRQGRTDAWIAHKLDVSIDQLERFKRDHDLVEGGSAPGRPADPLSVPPPEPELEAEPEPEPEPEPGPDPDPDPDLAPIDEAEDTAVGPPPLDFTAVEPVEIEEEDDEAEEEPEPADEPEPAEEPAQERAGRRGSDRERPGDRATGAGRSRRRGRRGGRRRRPKPASYEATFDHGEDGYGLWLDPSVVDNPVYAEHWAGKRAIIVTLDRDSITIRRADEDGAEGSQPPPS
jgi:hypothetical protein